MDGPAAIAELALELGEDRGRRLLLSLGARAALREFDKTCATRYALHLLCERCPRSAIRDRLTRRYLFSQRTAYRCMDAALIRFCHGGARAGETLPNNRDSNMAEETRNE